MKINVDARSKRKARGSCHGSSFFTCELFWYHLFEKTGISLYYRFTKEENDKPGNSKLGFTLDKIKKDHELRRLRACGL